MREDLAWTAGFKGAITAVLTNITGSNPTFVMNYTGVDIAFPQDVTPVEMATHWGTVEDANTQIVIPIISGSAGVVFANSYGTFQPGCIPIGINVLAQDADFWDDTVGLAEYGVTLESVFETNKTSKTIPFWNSYVSRFSTSPIYTAVGSYDAIHQLAWAFNESQSLNTDTVIAQLEELTTANPIEGAGSWAAFDASHCIIEGWPFGTALAIQWYDGAKILVPSVGTIPSGIYAPALLNMQPLQLPSWGLNFYD